MWQIHLLLTLCLLAGVPLPSNGQASLSLSGDVQVIEDFNDYRLGGLPTAWKYLSGRSLKPINQDIMGEHEYFVVKEENGRQFVRVHTKGEATRIIMPNEEEGFVWNLHKYPRLRWDWRVVNMPVEAREDEDDLNDTPAAVYVTFSVNFFGIPRSIKYTYSSTLPVGSVVSFRGLKVLVVASGKEGFNKWLQAERNVAKDYRELFGKKPPKHPLSIALWSDSDNTDAVTDADFDNLVLLPASDK